MRKCTKCGVNEIFNKRICKVCLDKWMAKRLQAWCKVVVEIGEPNLRNQKEFNKRLKKYENRN